MRLVTFALQGHPRLGVRTGDQVADLRVAAPDLPESWPEVFGALLLSRVEEAVASAPPEALHKLSDVRMVRPILDPPKILGVGLNYHAHAAELGLDAPADLVVFCRYPASLVGDGEALVRPDASEQFDYECELAAVIGKGGRHIPTDRALEHVVGYAIANDGSLRDFQFSSSQWTLGKNFDCSGAFGPDVVTADELPRGAAGLRLTTRLNGAVVQEGNTDDMIFGVAELVARLSVVMTLEPGDIILTGTPPGVGQGRKPPLWMKPGDLCEIEIEILGCLRNPVVAEGEMA